MVSFLPSHLHFGVFMSTKLFGVEHFLPQSVNPWVPEWVEPSFQIRSWLLWVFRTYYIIGMVRAWWQKCGMLISMDKPTYRFRMRKRSFEKYQGSALRQPSTIRLASWSFHPFMSQIFRATATIGAGGGIWLIYKISQIGKRAKDLPPGPPTTPLLGNLLQYPSKDAYLQWVEEHAKRSFCHANICLTPDWLNGQESTATFTVYFWVILLSLWYHLLLPSVGLSKRTQLLPLADLLSTWST